jgi:hypothetical protein
MSALSMRFGLLQVLLHEDAEADALAHRLAVGALEREAVMTALLDTAQPERVDGLVGDDQADHLGVEVAACGKIARCKDEMAGARDVERRIEVGVR